MFANNISIVENKVKFNIIRRYNVRNYRKKKFCNSVCRENQ